MYKTVCQRQVADGIVVLMPIEVIGVVGECLAQTVAVVEHRRDTIKTEAIKTELLQPVLAVGKQKMDDIVLPVVEAKAVPGRVLMAFTGIEILVGVTRKIGQPLHFVLHGVGMYNVHDDGNSQPVSLVYQPLQLLRSSETAARSEERADMIAERAVVRVLLHSHYLDGIVSIADNSRQDALAKLTVRAHFLLILRHTDVALVNQERLCLWTQRLRPPTVRSLGRPDLGRKDMRLLVLHHTIGPSRDALSFPSIPLDVHFVELSVAQCSGGKRQLPVFRVLYAMAAISIKFLPPAEVTHKTDACGMGCPLTEHPSPVRSVQPEVFMAIGKVG